MAVFDRDADVRRLDYELMADTFVTLFWRLSVFDEAVRWMADHWLDARRRPGSDPHPLVTG